MTNANCERVKLLDAKVEALWRLAEPRKKTPILLRCSIPLISDGDLQTADAAVQAIIQKYGIQLHDLNMLRRAHFMQLFHGYVRSTVTRVRPFFGRLAELCWH